MACMANIHSFILMDCRQMKEYGDTNEEVAITQVKVNKKDQTKSQQTSIVPNRPYSRSILLENIRFAINSLLLKTEAFLN